MADGDALVIQAGHQAFIGGKILLGNPPTLALAPDADALVLLPDVLAWAGNIEDYLNTLRQALIDRGIVVVP